MSVGKGATVHRLVSDGLFVSSSSVKTANNKIPVSSVFNDSEGLYGTEINEEPFLNSYQPITNIL